MRAHLIYASLSNITPPVAISVYVASGIADSNFTKTGIQAVLVGLSGFILPFFFLVNPILLLGATPEGTGIPATAIAIIGAAFGIYFLASGTGGWYIRRSGSVERAAAILIGLLLIHPAWGTDSVGVGIAAILTVYQLYRNKGDRANKLHA